MPAVKTLGIRRVFKSMIVAATNPVARTANAALDTGGSNRFPEHSEDRLTDLRHRTHGGDGDQGHQESVLQQVLSLVVPPQGADYRGYKGHGVLTKILPTGKRAGCRRPAPGMHTRRLRHASELSGDRGKDRVDRLTSRGHGRDRHEGDQGDEQRVLEQVLAFFVAVQVLHECYELRHAILLQDV